MSSGPDAGHPAPGPGHRSGARPGDRSAGRTAASIGNRHGVGARVGALVVALLAFAVHVPTLGNGFALDDTAIVQHNPAVHGLDRLDEAVTGPYWPGSIRQRGLYRPVTLATFAVDWEVGGGAPWVFHLGNVLLHSAVSVLVLFLLVRLGVGTAAAFAGAAVFAVHPVHVEAVAGVVGRAELLAALFYLGACLAYLRWPGGGWRTAALVSGLGFVALLSKEHAVTLPAALILMDWLRRRQGATLAAVVRRSWRVYVGTVVATVAYLVIRRVNIGVFFGTESPPWFWGLPDRARILTAVRVWPEYLRLMIAPVDLVPDYGPGVIVPVTRVLDPLFLVGLLTGVAVAAVAWRARRALPVLSGGIAWFALTVLPVTGLLFPVGVILAERTLYLPSVGVALASAAVAARVAGGSRHARTWTAALVVLLALAGVRTWTGGRVWRDSSSVLRHLAREHPANYRAQWALGSALAERGDTVGALQHLELATRMVPGYHNLRVEFARLLRGAGRHERALAQLDTALVAVPGGLAAHVERTRTLLDAGRPGEAAAAAAAGLALRPDHPVLRSLHHDAIARSNGVTDR